MRRTGSRDPRESLEASVVSPFSMAVNTFSMRFGSRRNQRPHHQKIRSITTVSPMIDTIKIGHMIGPPLWNLSINQLPARKPVGCSGVGEAAGEGLIAVAAAGLVTAPGAGLSVTGTDVPGTAGCCPCGTFVAGDWMGAAGFTAAGFVGTCAPGLVMGAPGGFCAGGGDCATNVSTSASKQAEAMNDVFIVLLNQECDRTVAVQECLYRKIITGESSKTFHFFAPEDCTLYFVISLQRGCKASARSLSSPKFRHFSPVERACDAIATVFRRRGQLSTTA